MKKLHIIVALLSLAYLVNGQNVSLQKGDKFTYRYSSFKETIKNNYRSSSKRNMQEEEFERKEFQIEVLDSLEDYYLLKGTLTSTDRYRRHKPIKSTYWESLNWYYRELRPNKANNSRLKNVGRVSFSDSMLIKLSMEGYILNIQNLDSLIYKDSLNPVEAKNQFKEFHSKYINDLIFNLSINQKIGELFLHEKSNYRIIEKNSDFWILSKQSNSSNRVESTIKVDARTGLLIESYNSEYVKKDVTALIKSKGNGLPMQYIDHNSESNNITRWNLVQTNEASDKFAYRSTYAIKDTTFRDCNVTIRGKIKNAPAIRKVSLKWLDESLSKDFSSLIITELDENNQFKIQLQIKDIKQVLLNCYNKKIQFYILPGDNIYLDIDYSNFSESLKAKGLGSNSFNYAVAGSHFDKSKMSYLYLYSGRLQTELGYEAFKTHFTELINKNIEFLDSWKNKLAPEVYLAEYWKYQTTLAKILQSYKGYQVESERNNGAFSSKYLTIVYDYQLEINKQIDIQNLVQPDNDLMMFYVGSIDYLYSFTFENLQKHLAELTGSGQLIPPDTISKSDFELISRYNFSHTYYTGKSAYVLKSETVKRAFLQGSNGMCEKLYKSFVNEYPLSAKSKYLENEYKRIQSISPGQSIYNFEFEDLNGKKVKLTDYKGKAVYLLFIPSFFANGLMVEDNEKYSSILYKNCRGRNVELIYILLDEERESSKAFFDKSEFKGEKLLAKGNIELIRKMFFLEINEPYSIILDVDGKIVYEDTPSIKEIIQDPNLLLKACSPLFRDNENLRLIFLFKIISFSLLVLVIIAFLVYIIDKRRAARRYKIAQLNTKVRELELTAIRAQMNPHFLYNCLNSIQNLVQKNQNEQAHLYLSKFATLIRLTLKNSDKEETSLSEELEMTKQYVELEQLRFDIDFKIDIDKSINLYSIFIPPLLLQPLVENAIIHGLNNKTDNKKLSIGVKRAKEKVCITIVDNGIGRKASSKLKKVSTGKGITFTKERLDLVSEKYGLEYRLNIFDLKKTELEEEGTKVEICFTEE